MSTPGPDKRVETLASAAPERTYKVIPKIIRSRPNACHWLLVRYDELSYVEKHHRHNLSIHWDDHAILILRYVEPFCFIDKLYIVE
jgi:hypothetical protein